MIGRVNQFSLPHQMFHRPADVGRLFLRQPQALGDHPRLDRLIVRPVDEIEDGRLKFVCVHLRMSYCLPLL